MNINDTGKINNGSTEQDKDIGSQMNNILSLVMAKSRGDSKVTDENIERAVSSLLNKDNSNNNENDSQNYAEKNGSQTTTRIKRKECPKIDVDDDEYDDLPPSTEKHPIVEEGKEQKQNRVSRESKPLTVESIRKQIKERDNNSPANGKSGNKKDTTDYTLYENIPLGRAGAQMLVTFGDGKKPNPDAVQEALLSTRKCLLYAIKDARALRRSERQEYLRARALVMHYNAAGTRSNRSKLRKKDYEYLTKLFQNQSNNTSANNEGKFTEEINHKNVSDYLLSGDIDHGMLYRAIAGYDKLSFDLPCGFDIDQLQSLFPEEMNAYERWNQMHKAYREQKAQEQTEKQNDEKENKEEKEIPHDDFGVIGGHLNERLEQFDVRTNLMNEEWYMKFADIRHKGSFLPNQVSGKMSADARDWEDKRKQNKVQGGTGVKKRERKAGDDTNNIPWGRYSAPTLAFLKWIGFGEVGPSTKTTGSGNDDGNDDDDYYYTLTPPNPDTTQALAFLAHDFLGRIVEKAIYLRNVDNHNKICNDGPEEGGNKCEYPLLELKDGEQLDSTDIERAFNDSTIKPVSLYSAIDDGNDTTKTLKTGSGGSSHSIGTQLYFGPGFEERLELELDELVANSKSGSKKKSKDGRLQIPQEELDTRKREDKMFERLVSIQPMGLNESLYKDLAIAQGWGDDNINDENKDIISKKKKKK